MRTKVEEVYDILLTPIIATKKAKVCYMDNGVIKSGQKYSSGCDEDMSDFSVGFYQIIYRDLLEGKKILDNNGKLMNSEYAGDTMNSFNTIANCVELAGNSKKKRTSMEKWPLFLKQYYTRYHCLANFWLLPSKIGRSMGGKMVKASRQNRDYMDRFLKEVKENLDTSMKEMEYFSNFDSWENFLETHFISESYCDKNMYLIEYSNNDDPEIIINEMSKRIEMRAYSIANSKYCNELWDYFTSLDIL